MDYLYHGDRITDPKLKKATCNAVRFKGKCVRGPMGTMLVKFEDGEKAVVIAKLLRKIKS